MRISDWSADVCSSDLPVPGRGDPVDGNTWRDRRTRQGSARHPCADVSPRPCAAQTRAVRTRHPMNLSTLVGEAGWLWLILAVGLGIAELMAPGVFMIFLAIAAAIPGVATLEIGRASCREGGSQSVSISVVAGSIRKHKKKHKKLRHQHNPKQYHI